MAKCRIWDPFLSLTGVSGVASTSIYQRNQCRQVGGSGFAIIFSGFFSFPMANRFLIILFLEKFIVF